MHIERNLCNYNITLASSWLQWIECNVRKIGTKNVTEEVDCFAIEFIWSKIQNNKHVLVIV